MIHSNIGGGIILERNRVLGFNMVTKLNDDTFVVMVEKAEPSPRYEGIYACLNSETAGLFSSEYKYMNRQQDMGIEGLRKAKLSWNPVKLIVCDTIIVS